MGLLDTIGGFMDIGTKVFGSGEYTQSKENSSGFTMTPQTTVKTVKQDMSAEGVLNILRTALEDPETGLAKLTSRTRAPGMYASTTESMLVDNLLKRIAMDVAEQTAPLIQTEKLSDWYQSGGTQSVKRAESGDKGLIGSIGKTFGCYITTACCKLYDKPDDCHELQTMRKFRDEFVKVKYPEAVTDYYATAPGIVAAIEAREDADEIWAHFYNDYLLPIIELVESGDYEEAYVGYTDMVIEAEELANG